MRLYKARLIASDLEKRATEILKGWEATPSIEDDYALSMSWKVRQCTIIIFIFWGDSQEGIRLTLVTPRNHHMKDWREVSGKVIDPIIDTLCSYATVAINERGK